MTAPTYRRVAIALIDVPEGRLRAVTPSRVETLSRDIAALGLLQPVVLVEEEGGRFTLVDGAHRLAACDLAGWAEIDARVTRAAWIKAEERRLQEIMANLDREQLTALDFAESLAELKRAHEALHPDTARGKGRSRTRRQQTEIFSFSREAAERTGMSVRSIEIAVAMVSGLADASKARVRGTWLADHQAGLRQISQLDADPQARVLDLLFSTPPAAASVADALALARGQRLPSAGEKLFASTLGNWSRLTERQRADFLDAHEAAIRDHARKRGWM